VSRETKVPFFSGSGRALLGLIALFCLCAWSARSGATTMRGLSLSNLVTEADAVVLGRALAIETLENSRGRIFRQVSFQVDSYILGQGPATVVVRLLGGRIGRRAVAVSGEAELTVGQEAVLFLERRPRAEEGYVVLGMTQGMFRVIADQRTQERFAARELGDLHLLGAPEPDSHGLSQGDSCFFIPLATFIEEIRRAAQER
jgi:hypothetical protein